MDRKGIFSNAIIMMFGTLISRFLGLLRESVMAFLFGATPAYDAFLIAFLIPNLLRQLLAEGALGSSFVPVFNEYLIKEGREGAWKLLNIILNLLFLLFGILIPLGYLLLPYLVKLLAPGFSLDTYNLCVSLAKITMPFIFFVSLAALTMGVLNSFGNFFIPGVASAFFNISIIVLSLFLYRSLGIYSVAIGSTLGGLLQWLFQLLWLRKLGWRHEALLDFTHEGIRRIALMMAPLTFGLAIHQVQNLVDKIVASLLSPGGISVINYAFRLYQLPLGVFAVSFSTVALPLLSQDVLKDGLKEFKDTLLSASKIALFIVIPASIFIFLYSPILVKIIFFRGAFSEWAFKNTYMTLRFYSVGLVFSALVHIFMRAFYALKDTKTPTIINAWIVVFNAILNIIFGKLFGPPGLALATSIAFVLNFLFLKRALAMRSVHVDLFFYSLKIFLPSLVFLVFSIFALLFISNSWLSMFFSLFMFLPYALLCRRFKIEEGSIFMSKLLKLLKKKRT
ncbi:MAG: murein biosynthesis integral membrane protein MurJ [Synergistetes bacterium]|nr:murein biosynthesis integral membrane protein MurJ [Synergistota bacterium]MDW8191351.1 murein biosynthesis integral membrane protein MurJ [Synergistota bacterium]